MCEYDENPDRLELAEEELYEANVLLSTYRKMVREQREEITRQMQRREEAQVRAIEFDRLRKKAEGDVVVRDLMVSEGRAYIGTLRAQLSEAGFKPATMSMKVETP